MLGFLDRKRESPCGHIPRSEERPASLQLDAALENQICRIDIRGKEAVLIPLLYPTTFSRSYTAAAGIQPHALVFVKQCELPSGTSLARRTKLLSGCFRTFQSRL